MTFRKRYRYTPPLSCHAALSCRATTSLIAPRLSHRTVPLSLCRPSLAAPPLSRRATHISSHHRLSHRATPCSCRLVVTLPCYEIRVLWYLLTVLTYQSHYLITLQSQKESHLIPSRIWTFHIIIYCGISIVSSQKLPDTLRIENLFFCQWENLPLWSVLPIIVPE